MAALSGSLTPREYAKALRRILAGAETHWSSADHGGREVYMFVSAAGFATSVRDYFATAFNDMMPTALGGLVAAIGVANDAPSMLLGHGASIIVSSTITR